MELNPDFSEFIALLNAHEVKYLVIGGYAVNYHGYPRYTRDIDFWLWMTDDNIQQLLTAIRAFGFGSLGLEISDFMTPDNIVQLGYEPYRIDLLVDVDGVDFTACYNRRKEVNIDGLPINFLALDDLIIAKRTTARPQDLADADGLEKLRDKNDQ